MLDINLFRNSPDIVKNALLLRQENTDVLDLVIKYDKVSKELLTQIESLRLKRNSLSSEINTEKNKDVQESKKNIVKEIKEQLSDLENEYDKISKELKIAMSSIPNILDPRTPIGNSEEDNEILKTIGERRLFSFTPRPHWEIGANMEQLDFQRGVRISGSRFYLLKSDLARLQRGLINYLLDSHVSHNYMEVTVPYILKKETVYNSGQLPKFIDNLYYDAEDDFWLIPTSEVPITSMHAGEILTTKDLPLYYCCHSPCFRREKMSAGRDVRGIKRGHQFDKVELYKFVAPETSENEHELMREHVEKICQSLEIPYRVKKLCTADIGFCALMTYDIEMWAPGCNEWLEVSSISNCGDFQARRSNIRFRRSDKSKLEFVHTLNGSGFGVPRTMIAIIENYQNADGTITVPNILRKYVNADVIGPLAPVA